MAKAKTASAKSKPKQTTKTAPPKKATPGKKSAPSKDKSSPKKGGAGRPPGHRNFVPSDGLSVRDIGKWKEYHEGKSGPRWVRIYASDQNNAVLLGALVNMVNKNDPALTKLLAKTAKS